MDHQPSTGKAPRIGLSLGIAAGAVLLLSGAAAVLWFKLPHWAPEFVIRHSPWVEPVLAAEAAFPGNGFGAEDRLKAWGAQATPALMRAFADSDPILRRVALRGLSSCTAPETVLAAISVVSDADLGLRYDAVNALGCSADPRAVGPLIAALADPELMIRESAADNLGRLGDHHAVAPLIAALADPDKGMRFTAVTSLQELGDRQATPPLVEIALRDSDADVKKEALRTLEDFKDPRTVDLFAAALADVRADVRMAAVEGLVHSRDQRAVVPLLALLADDRAEATLRYKAIAVTIWFDLTPSQSREVDAFRERLEKGQ